jgi:hypothetical protein
VELSAEPDPRAWLRLPGRIGGFTYRGFAFGDRVIQASGQQGGAQPVVFHGAVVAHQVQRITWRDNRVGQRSLHLSIKKLRFAGC